MKIKIGIVGCGVIGGVLVKWIEKYNKNCDVFTSDPPKGLNDDLSKSDVVFISIHIPTEPNGTQDLSILGNILKKLPDVPIFIRTTLLPGTCDHLSQIYNKCIYFMPEFLTERSAYEDFCAQPMIFTGEIELLKKIFINKEYLQMTSKEAEIVKYAHNVFGALKVTYFNGIYHLAQLLNCDYNLIRKGMLLSGYINDVHTQVPGPDGKFGYGGKCFPKDVEAFRSYINEDDPFSSLLNCISNLNKVYRR